MDYYIVHELLETHTPGTPGFAACVFSSLERAQAWVANDRNIEVNPYIPVWEQYSTDLQGVEMWVTVTRNFDRSKTTTHIITKYPLDRTPKELELIR